MSSYIKCLEHSMHSTSSAVVIIICFHKWDNRSSKAKKTKLYPHSPFYYQIHCQGRTLPYIPIHKASRLHSAKLLAFGRLRKQVWEQWCWKTQLDMDRLSPDTYPPAHKTTSSAGATTAPGELSPILRGQRHATPSEQQERTQQAGFLSMTTQVFIYSQRVPSSQPPKRPLCLVRTVSIK